MKLYFFLCYGMANAGSVWAKDEAEVRAFIRKHFNVKRCPNLTSIWEA